MRVALVVFANKYTGAAAVAEHCCRALHSAGVEARLLFVSGRNLERRLGDDSWAEPGLVKARSPRRLRSNLQILRRCAVDADLVISHLPHDHALCVAAGVHRRSILVRSFRNPAHLRRDPWHRAMARPVSGALLAHESMSEALHILSGPLPRLSLPVPVEDRFRPGLDPGPWRRELAIPGDTPVIGMVGKLAAGRGFDLLLHTAARVEPAAHVLAVGHGEARSELERLADRLGLSGRVRWTGYQAEGLPDLYSTMDVVLFTAPGSDHGHRAISEAQACARPVVAAAIPGVDDLIDDGVTGRIVGRTSDALATAVSALLKDPQASRSLGESASRSADSRRFAPSGKRLAEFLCSSSRRT
jgi:glycosyltransferase involved in cell wall biosynthesis